MDESRYVRGENVRGMRRKGNIDLTARPIVKNDDGSSSTVRSMSFEENGEEILVPTVSDDGRIVSQDEAIENYHKTGKHMGTFDTPDNATAYADAVHNDYAQGRIPGYLKGPDAILDDAETSIRDERQKKPRGMFSLWGR